MARGLDCGTMFLVKGELDSIDDGVSFEIERNVFAEVRQSLDDPEEVLKNNNYSYLKYKDNFYVVGEDVYKVHEIESLFKKSGSISYFSEVRRPMKNGLINTAEDKMSIAIIQAIIKKLIGKPSSNGEVLCFCVPGDPVTSNASVLFHKMMLTNFIKSLGYTPECINEAVAINYSECPVAEDSSEPDGIAKFSGITISCGAGMSNCALSWKQLPLLTFSIEKSGDWVDEEAAQIAGCDKATITKFKEKNLDLSNIDSSDLKQIALEVYYRALIENIISNFAAKFEKLEKKIDTPLEIILAGGTASVPGFVDKFKEVLAGMENLLPFHIKCVKLAKNPLYAVSNGCLIKAISTENKLKISSGNKNKENPSQKTKLNKE
jgi:hypothetical protein